MYDLEQGCISPLGLKSCSQKKKINKLINKELLSFSSALSCIIGRLKDLLTCYIYSYILVFYVWEYSWMVNTDISYGESHCHAVQLVQ